MLRSAVVKSKSISKKIVDWYSDLQSDYKKFFELFYSWTGDGYTKIADDGKPIFTEPEKVRSDFIQKTQDPNVIQNIDGFISQLSNGGNLYSIFVDEYKANSHRKYTDKIKNTLELISTSEEDILDEIISVVGKDGIKEIDDLQQFWNELTLKEIKTKIENYEILSDQEWKNVIKEIKGMNNSQLKYYWEKNLGKKFVIKQFARQVKTEYLDKNNIKCLRSSNKGYCTSLTEMVSRQIRSQREKAQFHQKELNELQEEVNKFKNDELVKLIDLYNDELLKINSGLSRYVLINAIKQALKPNEKRSPIEIQVNVIKNPKFSMLLKNRIVDKDFNLKEINDAFAKWKKLNNLKKRFENRKYVLYPSFKGDFKVPIGLTGLGPGFEIKLDQNKNIIVTIKDVGDIVCFASNYLGNLQVEEYYKEKEFVGYKFKFNHKINLRGRKRKTAKVPMFGPPLECIVKEIGLQKKQDGNFYVTFGCNIEENITNENINRFFNKAEFDKELGKKIPDKFIAAGFDLNISMPLPCSLAIVERNSNEGNLNIPDYGMGKVFEIEHLVFDGKKCRKIIDLKRSCNEIKNFIREVKSCINNKDENGNNSSVYLSEETWEKLQTHKGNHKLKYNPTNPNEQLKIARFYIQNAVAGIRKKLRQYKYELRQTSYENISEAIRLLDANDAYYSMVNSYDKIHLKSGMNLLIKPKFNNKRENFRLYVTRRLAALIAAHSLKHNVNIVFCEDLTMKQDGDKTSQDNSLTRLFAPRLLLDTIESALKKVGIGFCRSVDPRGTSKTDSMTGELGCRSEDEKRKLFVHRNNKIRFIDSDLNASLNVLIRGLGRSIVPYKFFVCKNSEESVDGKRITKFIRDEYGSKVRFYESNNEVLVSSKKIENSTLIEGKYLYYRNGKVILQKQHREEEDKFKAIIKKIKEENNLTNIKSDDVLNNGMILNFQASAFMSHKNSEKNTGT